MTDYTIKKYHEGFEEKQAELGTEVSKNWQQFGQTPADRLKEAYSQPEFDPETRLYAFKGEEMVGFLTSAVNQEQEDGKTIATLSIPIVKVGHEEALTLLMDKALQTLKDKGTEVVRTVASNTWGDYAKIPEKWEFEKVRVNAYLVSQKLDSIKTVDDVENVLLYDKERDLDQLVEIFVKELGMTEEQAIQNFEVIDTAENILGHYVVRVDDKIVARTFAQIDPEQNESYVGYIYATDEKYRKQLISKIVHQCKEKGIEEVKSFLFGGMVDKIDEYKEMGFEKQGKSMLFEKKL